MMLPNGIPGGAPEGNAASAAPGERGEMINLSAKMEKSDCYAMNEDTRFPMTNLFIGDTRLGCKSDADEQLIIHIAFQEFVKVSCAAPGLLIFSGIQPVDRNLYCV